MVEEWCGDSGGRLVPLIIIPLWDAELAADEVRRNAERGVRAVTFCEIPPNLGLPSIHSGEWDPFFQACDETSTVINMHVGSSSKMPATGPDAPVAVALTLTFGNAMASLTDWLFSGKLQQFPNLRLAYSEGQIGWLPYVLERADDVWEEHRAAGVRTPSSNRRAPPTTARCLAPLDRLIDTGSGAENRVVVRRLEDRDAGGAGGAVELGVADLRVAGHLPVAGLAAELAHDLVDLAQPRRADRLAVGDEPAVGVHRQRAVDLGGAVGDQRLLLAVGAEAVLGQVDHLGAGVGVLQLDDVDVLGTDARHLVRLARRVDGRADRLLDRQPRAVHLERAEPPRAHRRRPQVDGRVGVAVRVLGLAEHHRRRTLVGAAEHVLRERVVEHRRVEDLVLRQRLAAERVRVERPVAVVLRRRPWPASTPRCRGRSCTC